MALINIFEAKGTGMILECRLGVEKKKTLIQNSDNTILVMHSYAVFCLYKKTTIITNAD